MIVYGINLRSRTIAGTTPEPSGGDRPGYKCPWCPAEVTDGLAPALTLFERHGAARRAHECGRRPTDPGPPAHPSADGVPHPSPGPVVTRDEVEALLRREAYHCVDCLVDEEGAYVDVDTWAARVAALIVP